MTDETQANGHDLRTVTPRLADLQRKCRSVGSRNQEAEEMEKRIESILNRLEPEDPSDAEPIPFAALARELYAVERFFESNGFLSVAKEVAHVERTLESFAPPDEPEPSALPTTASEAELETTTEALSEHDDTGVDSGPSRWAVPKPLAMVMALSLAALVVCVWIIVRHQNAAGNDTDRTAFQPRVGPTIPPRPSPVPTITSTTQPAPGAILAEGVGKARLALAEGDIEAAMDHLSQAALVDPDHGTVLGTATQIVNMLVDRSEVAADGGLWEIADLTLAKASRVASRFGLDTHRINQAARRHAQMDRFTLINPGDADAIRGSAGKRVTVMLKDGSKQEAVLKGVRDGQLLLDEDTAVRGGTMYYIDKVPLNSIDYLKVWEE